MATWERNSNLDSSTINGGRKYEDNDGVTVDAINTMFETLLYVDYMVKNIKVNVYSVSADSSASVNAYLDSDKLLTIDLSIPRGQKGDKGDKGDKGSMGDKGATFSLSGDVLTITSNT